MINATCQKEAFPLAGNLSKPDIWPRAMLTIDNTTDRKAGGAILTIPKALSAVGHYPVLDNAVMHGFLLTSVFAYRVCNAVATEFLESIKKGGISATPWNVARPGQDFYKVQKSTLEQNQQLAAPQSNSVNIIYSVQPFGGYLALRRCSSSRATLTSRLISSLALTPIASTCSNASSDESKGFSAAPSVWRLAISPRIAATINPALLSSGRLTASMSSITSWGTLIVVICDFAFLYTDIVNHLCVVYISLYMSVRYKNTCNVYHHRLVYISLGDLVVYHLMASQRTKPGSASTLTGLLTTAVNDGNEVAMSDHTTPLAGRNSLTLNKFTWRFLAVSRSDRNAKPCRMSVEAHTEREARQVLAPHFILSLAARLPVQGVGKITTPSTIEKTSTVQEVSYA